MTATMARPDPAAIERIGALAGELLAHDTWPRERLERHQRELLLATLRHAVSASPYYRETLGPEATAPDVDLAALPVLTKETLLARFDDVVTDPRIRLADLEAHLAHPEAGELLLGAYRVFSTSGTTGLRGLMVYDRLSVTTPLVEMVEALNAYRPEAIVGYPTVAALLADEQLEGRLDIAPRILACGSEPITADIVRRVEAARGVRPANVYATTEVPIVASSSPQDPCLDIAEDVAVVEVQADRILVTSLASRALPLIRYEIGDVVTTADGPSPAGRPYRRLASVEGRSGDVLRLTGRDGGRVAVHPFRLGRPLAAFPEVRQFQVRVSGERVTMHVVLRPSAPRDVPDRLRAAIAGELADAGAAAPDVAVEQVAAIVRDPGPGAKLKLVQSRA